MKRKVKDMASIRFISNLDLQIDDGQKAEVVKGIKFGDSYKIKAIGIIDDNYRNIYFDNGNIARGVHKDVFEISNNVEIRAEQEAVETDNIASTEDNYGIRKEDDAEHNSEA